MNPHDTGCKRKLLVPTGTEVTAQLDGAYRYKLQHRWGPGPLVMFAMMNPSDADLIYTDATVAKSTRLAKLWGFGGLLVGNACAYRATQQKRLLEVKDPVGPGNASALVDMAIAADMVVIAHGRLPGNLQCHASTMSTILRNMGFELHILRILSGNCPAHPLGRGKGHIPEDIRPTLWR